MGPALNSQPLFRRCARKQVSARHLQDRDPLHAVDLDLCRGLARWAIESGDQIIEIAQFVSIDFLQRVATENRHGQNLLARYQSRCAQRTVRANFIYFDAAPESELAKRIEHINRAGGDQDHRQSAQDIC